MKILFYIVLVILIFLAISSGAAKLMLMQHEVDFYEQYGFTNALLVFFGSTQLFGGALLALPKTRVVGAIIVGITFLISAVMLVIAGDVVMAIVTLAVILLLGFVIKRTLPVGRSQ